MAMAPAKLLLKELRDGMDQLRARMEESEANRNHWMEQWSSLREKLCSPKAREMEFVRVARATAATLEVFDKIPLKETTTIHPEDVVFMPSVVSQSDACELLDERYHKDTIWDEEIGYNLDSHGLLQHKAQRGYNLVSEKLKPTPKPFTCDMLAHDDAPTVTVEVDPDFLDEGFAETNSTVMIWDEDIPHSLDLHNNLLEQFTDIKQGQGHNDLFPEIGDSPLFLQQSGVTENGIFHEVPAGQKWNCHSMNLFNGEGKGEVSACSPEKCTLQTAHLLLNKMPSLGCFSQCSNINGLAIQGGLDDLPHIDVVWDEKPAKCSHDGLLQQLACGKEYVNAENTEPIVEPNDDQVSLEHGMGAAEHMDMNNDLLQLLARGGEYPDLEKPETRPIVSLQMGMTVVEHMLLPMCNLDMNSDTMHVEEIPTWLYGGFIPGKIEQQVGLYWMAKKQGDTLVAKQSDYKLNVVQQDGSKNCLLPFDKQTEFFSEVKEPEQHCMANGEIHWTVQMGKMAFNVASSLRRRQWDPGIMQVHVLQWDGCEHKCCNVCYAWTRCYDVAGKELLNAATAWGQAVFRGGGNVMTHIWTKRSPSLESPVVKSQPSPAQESVITITGTMPTREESIRNQFIQNRTARDGSSSSSSSYQRSYPLRFPCDLLTLPELISPAATGHYTLMKLTEKF